jgi:hypothetical protein
MKASEIMLNNYVKDHLGRVLKVVGLKDDNVYLVLSNKEKIRYNIKTIQGLELTEEILLKCPKIEKSDDYGDQIYFNLIGTRYWFCLDHDDFSFGIYNKKDNKSDITILNYYDLGISVHTFQNIIYALTNEELTINL